MMANKAMVARHWERMANLTGHTFDVESDAFLLRGIMEAPLLENKEDIEVHSFTRKCSPSNNPHICRNLILLSCGFYGANKKIKEISNANSQSNTNYTVS